MARRLLPMEELARDICWTGFNNPPDPKFTAKSYWETLTAEARNRYRSDAKSLIDTIRRLKLSRVVQAYEEIP